MADESFSIEIGDNYLRLSDVAYVNNQFNFSALGGVEKPTLFFTSQSEKSLNDTATEIDKLVKSLKINKKTVNVIIPDTYTYSQILTMPYLKEKELLSAIKYQADQFIPLPIDDTSIDLDILSEDKKKNSLLILIVAAPNNLVGRVSSLIEKVGLIPQSIENQTSSVSRVIDHIGFKQATVFANIDYYSTTLYFYNPQLNLISNIYNFKIGLNLFSKEIQVNYNFDPQKSDQTLKTIGFATNGSMNLDDILQPALNEFVAEVEKFTVSIKEKENISKIDQIVTFNQANKFNQFENVLQKRLGINTLQFDLAKYIVRNNNALVFDQSKSSFISVLGEALR